MFLKNCLNIQLCSIYTKHRPDTETLVILLREYGCEYYVKATIRVCEHL